MPLRVVFLGMRGPFSATVLEELLNRGVEITGVVMPQERRPAGWRRLPVAVEQVDDIETIALHQGIQCLPIRDLETYRVHARIRHLAPDIFIVACFPMKIPAAFIRLAGLGGFNLHPSLLPRYRGPVPLFWQFRDGCESFGVTLHRLDERFDSGHIVKQQSVVLPDGISGPDANRTLARAGAALVQDMIHDIDNDRFVEIPQDDSLATSQGWPDKRSFHLSPLWTARRAWNFIKGTRHWRQPYIIEYPGKTIIIDDAIAYTAQHADSDIVDLGKHRRLLRFRHGSLMVSR